MSADLLAEGLVTVADAASYLALSPKTIWRLMGDGTLPYTRLGRNRRIPRLALKSYAAKGLVIGGL